MEVINIPPFSHLLEMAKYNNQTIDYKQLGICDPVAFQNGELPITDAIATKLEQNGYVTKQFWLKLQSIYERKSND